MNCIEFNSAIEERIERREPLDPAEIAHVTSCAACRKELELHQSLDAAITAWCAVQPSQGFVDAVLAELSTTSSANQSGSDFSVNCDEFETVPRPDLRQDSRSSRRIRRLTRFAFGTVSACLCIVVVFVARFSGELKGEQLDAVVDSAPAHPLAVTAVGAQPRVSETISGVLSELREEYISEWLQEYDDMASETAASTKAVVNELATRSNKSVVTDPSQIDLIPNPKDVSRMWRPIGSRVQTALGFLRYAVPSEFPSG